MTLGNSKNSMRNTGPTLSPKENIKKLKSSFFGSNKIDENKMDCASGTIKPVAAKPTTKAATNVTTNSKNAKCDEGDYTIMNPILNRRNVSSSSSTTTQQHPSSAFATTSTATVTTKPTTTSTATKKTALVTIDPDKVMANAQSKTNIDGFKPIRADKEAFQQHNRVNPTTNATAFNRQHSVPVEKLQRKHSSTTSANDNGGYELLELRSSSSSHAMMNSASGAGTSGNARIARPNSVNSEKTSFAPLMRPNSANSERQSTSTFSLTSTPLNESGAQSVRK